MYLLLEMVVFHCYVSLPECSLISFRVNHPKFQGPGGVERFTSHFHRRRRWQESNLMPSHLKAAALAAAVRCEDSIRVGMRRSQLGCSRCWVGETDQWLGRSSEIITPEYTLYL